MTAAIGGGCPRHARTVRCRRVATACPLCGGLLDAELGTCACGYSAREVAALEREVAQWDRRRWTASAVLTLGLGLVVISPAIMVELTATVGGLLLVGGGVFWARSRYYLDTTRRALHAETTPRSLPPARIV